MDLLLAQISQNAERHADAEYRILFCGPRSLDFALPFAAMGFAVTVRFASETEMQAAQRMAEEIGVTADLQVGDPFVGSRSFDAVVLSEGWVPHEDVENGLTRIRESLKDGGLLFVVATKVAADGHVTDYRDTVKKLRRAQWLPVRSENVSAVLSKYYAGNLRPAIKRGRNKHFHVLDWLDGRAAAWWPHGLAGGWLFACRHLPAEKFAIQIIPTLSSAGAERVALSLATGLPSRGYTVLTVANVCGGPLETEFEKRGLPYLIVLREGFWGRLNSALRLARLLSDAKPDVVQTHLFGADFWGRLAARLAGVKNVVTTEHNVRTEFGWVGRLAMRLMAGFSKRYVAISPQTADHLAGLGIARSRIRLVPNGVDINSIIKRSPRPMRDVPRLLFVGRLEAQKDPETMLRALSKIRAPWELTVAGGGSLERGLKGLSDELGIASRVHWQGNRSDVSDVYAEHDLMLLPSKYEGFGLVAVEAAVAGIPIVASDLPVLQSLLTDDGATFVKPGDVEAWAEAIRQTMGNPLPAVERARRLAARDWSRHSVEAMVEGYTKVYGEIASCNM